MESISHSVTSADCRGEGVADMLQSCNMASLSNVRILNLSGDTVASFQVDTETTVLCVKSRLQVITGINFAQQRLLFQCQVLDDCQFIAKLGLDLVELSLIRESVEISAERHAQGMKSKQAHVRESSCQALEALGSAAAPYSMGIARCLHDEDEKVRYVACCAVVHLHTLARIQFNEVDWTLLGRGKCKLEANLMCLALFELNRNLGYSRGCHIQEQLLMGIWEQLNHLTTTFQNHVTTTSDSGFSASSITLGPLADLLTSGSSEVLHMPRFKPLAMLAASSIASFLTSPSAVTRACTCKLLYLLGPDAVERHASAIAECLPDADCGVRYHACRALALIPAQKADIVLPGLFKCFADETLFVRKAAADALSRFKPHLATCEVLMSHAMQYGCMQNSFHVWRSVTCLSKQYTLRRLKQSSFQLWHQLSAACKMRNEEVTCVLRHAYGTAACKEAKIMRSVLRNAYITTASASMECVTRSLLRDVYHTTSYDVRSGTAHVKQTLQCLMLRSFQAWHRVSASMAARKMVKKEVACVLRNAYDSAACSAAKITRSVLRNAYAVAAGAGHITDYDDPHYDDPYHDDPYFVDPLSEWLQGLAEEYQDTYQEEVSRWYDYVPPEADMDSIEPFLSSCWRASFPFFQEHRCPAARREIEIHDCRRETEIHVCKRRAKVRCLKLQYVARRKEKQFGTGT
mmetsp:Transcript_123152/g.217051  ORF Transcript_123152/g.217051 Transcript_123152/m.217051 type:complete len:690 (-) Transcript_123152:289-2358(-)